MKVLFVSLGCDKNLADSEKMLGALKYSGHELTDNEEEAEAAVVNTCCFIHDAKQESIETILSLAQLKETASLKYLVITGCLAQRYRDEIIDSIPEVDSVLGTTAYDEIPEVLSRLEANSLKALYDGSTHTAEGLKKLTFELDGHSYEVRGITASASAAAAFIMENQS